MTDKVQEAKDNCGPYCFYCGDCMKCYAEDECLLSYDSKHHSVDEYLENEEEEI